MSLFPWQRRPKEEESDTAEAMSGSSSASLPMPEEAAGAPHWQALLETTEDAILLADAEGHIRQSNSVASALFGISGSGTLLAHTLSSELEDLYRTAIRRQTGVEREVTLSQPPRALYVRIAPISPNEYLLVLRDLTELRRLERVRRDFVANVSHELRTPLTSIKAMAETLLDGALGRRRSCAALSAERSFGSPTASFACLPTCLDLSRVEAVGIEKKPVDLAPLVIEVASRLGLAG